MHLSATALSGRFIRLEPFKPELKEEVRGALDCDPDAWEVMLHSAYGKAFDGWWDRALESFGMGERIPFAVRLLNNDSVVGSTSLLSIRPAHRSAEIGFTFYAPEWRSGFVNPESKLLLLDHAFTAGAMRVEFGTDALNQRCRAAMLKLGAQEEAVLRKHRITWTGRVRDTVMYSIVDDEWPHVRANLERRLSTAVA